MEMKELEEKLEILNKLEYVDNYSKEKVRDTMKQVVPTYKEPEEVNKEIAIK